MSRPITVVQFWAGCPRSANSKWQRFLAVVQRCRQEGWRNVLVLSRIPDDPALVEPFTEAGCEIVLQPRSRGNFDPASIWRTYRLLRRLKCDIFHCHNDHTSPLIGAALARVPVRVWSKLAMSSHYEEGTTPQGIHRLQASIRLSTALAHKVHTVSDAVRRELLDLGIAPDKVQTIRCPIDLERYNGADGSAVRRELGVSAQELLITAVGHAVAVKGWDVLVRAFKNVASEFPQARLALVGNITAAQERPFVRKIEELVQEARLSGRVRLLGIRSDIPACLAGSDVFVLPSRSEGQPLALMEAMASGLPCVAAAVGGIPETITHEVDGLLFDREDASQLTDRLKRMLSNADLRHRLSEAARKKSAAFGLDAYVKAVFGVYRNLLCGKAVDTQDPLGGIVEATPKAPTLRK